MLKRFANTAAKQAKAANKAQLMKYATAEEGKVTLSEEVRSHLKPEVLQIIESKSDYALVKKLNHLGKHGAVRLNTASKIQLVSINAQTVFKIVCFELEDPWVYYWTRVQDNGSDPQKWLASLKEVANVPALVERCYRQMLLSNCYPRPEHYAEFMKATAAIGDIHSASIIADDFTRCATSKIVKKPNPDMWKALLDTFINSKDYDLALLSKSQMEKKKVNPEPEQESKLNALKAKYDPKARGDFLSGKTQTKSQYDVDMEEQEKAFLSTAIQQVNDFIQPPFERLIMPDLLAKRKSEGKV